MSDMLSILFKNNELIKTRHSLTLEESRFLEIVLLEVQKQKSNIVFIDKETIDSNISNNNFKTQEGFKEFFDTLMKNTVEIKKGKSWGKIALISTAIYDNESMKYRVEVPITLLELLITYKQTGFTPINVGKFVSLNKTNAQRFYELLRMWTNSKEVIEYNVDDIKLYLKIENKYKLFKDFRVRVIEPAIKELKEKDMLDIYKVEYIRKGRKINSIKFYVKDLEPRNQK